MRPLVSAALAGVLALGVSGCRLLPNDNTLPGQVAVGDDGYSVTVYFDRVENLVANSTVQRDDSVIGTVARVEVDDWKAKVTLRLKRSVHVPENAVFAIGQKTLLGAQYVEVRDPDAGAARGRLRAGQVVGVDRTGSFPATEQVLASASLLLNNGGLSQISTITGELNEVFDRRVPDARSVVRRLNELLRVLEDNKSQIVSTLESMERLSGRLAGDRDTIARALDQVGPGLAALNAERTVLVRALRKTGRLGTDASRLVALTQEDLVATVAAVGPVLARLEEASEALPDALKVMLTVPFPAMTAPNAIQGDYTNLFATVDLSSTSLARAFLASRPAVQAGNPVTDPLGDASPGQADRNDPSLLPGLPLLGNPQDGATSGRDSLTCSVLSLLGGCR